MSMGLVPADRNIESGVEMILDANRQSWVSRTTLEIALPIFRILNPGRLPDV
jgi:hypothetical protein